MSDDRRLGITVIAFVGSVFSPKYARARRQGPADPRDFCELNVALYGPGIDAWAMTHWPRRRTERTAERYRLGQSALRWTDTSLEIDINERQAPWPRALRGHVQIQTPQVFDTTVYLDRAQRHRWRPIAPTATFTAEFSHPATTFSGHAYVDSNEGDEPLERAFVGWNWSRSPLPDGSAAVLYDVLARGASRPEPRGWRFFPDGTRQPLNPPERHALPRGRWGMPRATRADAGGQPQLQATLTDAPFYTRSLLATRVEGETVSAMHESLSLDRFTQGWVQFLLPFRMRRQP